jgi:hydroxypyruvate reductase
MSGADARRSLLTALYDVAVRTAHPATCVPSHLPPPPAGRIIVIGAGKASAAMAVAAEQHYVKAGVRDRVTGFITTRYGFALPTDVIAIVEASHPVPDANGLAAAARTLELARQAGPDDIVLCLLSGGASALWPAPVDGVSLEDKQALTRALLKSGARISEINAVRRHLSRIKGGKLAAAAYPARLLTLAISDVPGDDPESIGSGPTVPDPTTLADARAILERYRIVPPPAVERALADAGNETPKPGDPRFTNARYQIVARPAASLAAAAEVARQAGYEVTVLGDALEGEAREVGQRHARLAREALAAGRRSAILSGGELTVTVTGNGVGGPNQEYAMGLALGLDGASGICAVAGDTDGIDGGGGEATDPAGAFVFQDTVPRARDKGLDAAAMLADNDSTRFFSTLGDLLRCGPTQTNVNDLRAILVDPA